MARYIHNDDGTLHIKVMYIIREYMRLKGIQEYPDDNYFQAGHSQEKYREGGEDLAAKLLVEAPIKDFNLCLDDFSDKYIAPMVS
jgi:hypothetical protein